MTWEYDKSAVMVGELFTWKSAPFAVLTGEDQMSLFSVPGLAGTDVLSQKATSVDLEDGMSLLVLEKRYANTRKTWVRVLLSTSEKTWEGWVSHHRIRCHVNKHGETTLWVKSS